MAAGSRAAIHASAGRSMGPKKLSLTRSIVFIG
jgi:hypothetical protein